MLADSFGFVPHKPFYLEKRFPFLRPEGQQGRDRRKNQFLGSGAHPRLHSIMTSRQLIKG